MENNNLKERAPKLQRIKRQKLNSREGKPINSVKRR
jgi:hypothetical protein